MSVLAQRLGVPPHPQTELSGLPDWQAAEVLNAPDPSLPETVTLERTLVGPAEIMDALGPEAGAAFLSAVEAASSSSAVLHWGMYEIKNGGLDVARDNVRTQIQSLAQAGMLTNAQSQTLLALAERRKRPSWAEANGIEVTARTVGLARGAR
jgi:hypothetical protein